ncbi:MAG TPA: hypothetical protein DC001_03570, partial [Clostridiales bacterium]|nr:hypothetical protein [Clostridiales bacterium]
MKSNQAGRMFDNKVFRVVLSLFAALLMWIYITGTQEAPIDRVFDNVEVVFSGAETMKESKGFVVTDVDTERETVRITGTRKNIGKLGSSDLKAMIDLSKVTRIGNNLFRYDIEYPDTVDKSSVSVISYSPENIQFYVAKLSTKVVPVKGAFLGGTAEGHVAEDLEFDPETVTLSGPDSELEHIEYVWVTLGGDNVSKTKTAEVTFTYMDKDGNQLDYTDITADYDKVSVTLPIKLKKDVPLSVALVEGSGATKDNTIITIEPAIITIQGEAALVEGINKIVLETIDLTDFSDTLEGAYPIVLDNEVQNVTGITEAKVKVEIVGLKTKKLTVRNMSYI